VGNVIVKKLVKEGYEVYPVNPHADTIDGLKSYAKVSDVPSQVEAVVLANHPDKSLEIVRDCGMAGVQMVWFHRSADKGSFSQEAYDYCVANGLIAIPAGCPMMYCRTADVVHRCMRWMLTQTGKLPKSIHQAS
jgi:predicted CoA-binding protein